MLKHLHDNDGLCGITLLELVGELLLPQGFWTGDLAGLAATHLRRGLVVKGKRGQLRRPTTFAVTHAGLALDPQVGHQYGVSAEAHALHDAHTQLLLLL
jgi:hypothetical protein